MGLFDRKPKAAPAPMPELPPTLSDADLARAARLLDRFEAAMGNSDAIWTCLEDFAKLGGFPGLEWLLGDTSGRPVGEILDRTWRWWAEAALLANARGEYAIAARVFMFSWLIATELMPKASANAQMDIGLTTPTQGTYQRIVARGAEALAQLPPDQIIINTAVDKIPVASALLLAKSIANPSINV